VFFDESLLELGIDLALEAPLGEPSYHLTIGNPKHASIQHLSHGIFHPPCFYVMHSSISIDKGFGPNMVALQ
jgi:hypothetical protein